jgi:tRNA dimethylallyltransferase
MDKATERPTLTPDSVVIVILGATATGKTALAVRVAGELGGEVVSADSRYFYQGMDIGTAKPTLEEQAGIPHHLIDIADPLDDYSLSRFLQEAYGAVEGVIGRGRVPIVAGGTPQYLRAFIEGWRVPEVPPNTELRARLGDLAIEELNTQLRAVDPASAERIGPDNKRRIIRALEIHEVTGTPMSVLAVKDPPPYRYRIIGLRQDRERLYARIDQRVHDMFAGGWLDEVRALHERGVSAATPAMSAHGYREALEVALGQTTLDDAVTRTQRMVHKYVRHQETWFRRFPDVHWFDSSSQGYEDDVVALLRSMDVLA